MPSDAPTAFFSYSREDLEFALRLARDLKAAGASVWMDKLDVRPGQPFRQKIEKALTTCPRLLVILSPASVDSAEVMAEVYFALDEHKEVIPVVYRDCKIPYRLRLIQHVDFRGDYTEALAELLSSMGVEPAAEQTAVETAARNQSLDPKIDKGTSAGPARAAEENRELEAPERGTNIEGSRRSESQQAPEKQPLGDQQQEEQLGFGERTGEQKAPDEPVAEILAHGMEVAAAPARSEHSRVEMGSTDQGSFFHGNFSWTFAKRAGFVVGAVIVVLLIYLAVRSSGKKIATENRSAPGPTSTSETPRSPASTSARTPNVTKANGTNGSAPNTTPEVSLPPGMDQKLADVYRRAVAGDSGAMDDLGFNYEKGVGVKQDYQEAAKWYRKAADAGNEVAMADLSRLYQDGHGVSLDYQQALFWDTKAAQAGNSDAMVGLGQIYGNGRGVARDYPQALAWYRKAVDAGNSVGMVNLGYMYEQGQGVQRDYAQAVKWYQKAADNGNPIGMNNLGLMYEKGEGVRKDQQQAIIWYRKAAKLENQDAIDNLGRLGVSQQ